MEEKAFTTKRPYLLGVDTSKTHMMPTTPNNTPTVEINIINPENETISTLAASNKAAKSELASNEKVEEAKALASVQEVAKQDSVESTSIDPFKSTSSDQTVATKSSPVTEISPKIQTLPFVEEDPIKLASFEVITESTINTESSHLFSHAEVTSSITQISLSQPTTVESTLDKKESKVATYGIISETNTNNIENPNAVVITEESVQLSSEPIEGKQLDSLGNVRDEELSQVKNTSSVEEVSAQTQSDTEITGENNQLDGYRMSVYDRFTTFIGDMVSSAAQLVTSQPDLPDSVDGDKKMTDSVDNLASNQSVVESHAHTADEDVSNKLQIFPAKPAGFDNSIEEYEPVYPISTLENKELANAIYFEESSVAVGPVITEVTKTASISTDNGIVTATKTTEITSVQTVSSQQSTKIRSFSESSTSSYESTIDL